MTERILLTGAYGRFGTRFREMYQEAGLEQRHVLIAPDRSQLDMTAEAGKPNSIETVVGETNPTVIVNMAAFTDVGGAERPENQERCLLINARVVERAVEAARHTGAFFIQLSTDMVYPGSLDDPGPYAETHPVILDLNKLTFYGYSKALGELAAENILRIIYPVKAKHGEGKHDYFTLPLSLYLSNKLYPLFTDQYVSVTYLDEAFAALMRMIENRVTGIVHAGSSGVLTAYEVISYAIGQFTHSPNILLPRTTVGDFLAARPNLRPQRYPIKGGLLVAESEKILRMKYRHPFAIVDQINRQGLVLPAVKA